MSIYNKRLALNNSIIITSIAGVCLVLVIMPLGLVFAQSNSPTLTYKNDAHGFMIQYPADWQKHDGQPGDTIIVTFTSPLKDSQDKFTETFNIGIEGLTFPNYPLDQYSESAMGQLKSVFPEFRLEHLDANASLSGYPAFTKSIIAMSLILKKDQSRLKIYKSGPLVEITPTYLLLEWNQQNILNTPHL